MQISQATYDRYATALTDYEKVVAERQSGWERYQDEAVKIRNLLAGSTIKEEVGKVLRND